MKRHIIKLGAKYLVWSTESASPITKGFDEHQLKSWLSFEYGKDYKLLALTIEEAISRANENGTSEKGCVLRETICTNNAGKNGTHLNASQLYRSYVLGEEIIGCPVPFDDETLTEDGKALREEFLREERSS